MKVICNYQDFDQAKKEGLKDLFDNPVLLNLSIFNSEFGLFKSLKNSKNIKNGIIILEKEKDFEDIGKKITGWPTSFGKGLDFWKSTFEYATHFEEGIIVALVLIGDFGDGLLVMFEDEVFLKVSEQIAHVVIPAIGHWVSNEMANISREDLLDSMGQDSVSSFEEYHLEYENFKKDNSFPKAQD